MAVPASVVVAAPAGEQENLRQEKSRNAAANGSPDTTAKGARSSGRSATLDARVLIDFIIARRFAPDPEFARTTHDTLIAHRLRAAKQTEGSATTAREGEVDYLFLCEDDPREPAQVFDRLRWGGQVVYISRNMKRVVAAVEAFEKWTGEGRDSEKPGHAWVIEQPPATEKKYLFNLRLLGLRIGVHYMVARKVLLVAPGKSSDRFTYHVYLQKGQQGGKTDSSVGAAPAAGAEVGHGINAGYEVVKEVPTVERVLTRLRDKFPEADEETLRRRARKFAEKIFPVFLTREAAILKLLHRDLPRKFRHRVPRVITAEQDLLGYVRTLRMKWLRNGRGVTEAGVEGKPLSQLEFARQAAELLTALHDEAQVMHLDLRLDNFVITEHGVGFVDFGSAVRVGEAFAEASLLSNLFGEMMRTSQIQRMMGKMTENGQVTNEEIRTSFNRIDKAADFFYLAVQINAPHSNPDFRGLVTYDKDSDEARELAKLTEEILRPTDGRHARFKSAREILHGIEEIQQRLA